jgi:hypothetical protein
LTAFNWKHVKTTSSGALIDFSRPLPSQIHTGDLIAQLSLTNRFAGATFLDGRPQAYSVLQHSIIVGWIMEQALGVTDPNALLQGLLHDAPEAYIGDVPSPAKSLMPDYKKLEKRLWAAIALKFNIPVTMVPEVKKADGLAYCYESRLYMAPSTAVVDALAGREYETLEDKRLHARLEGLVYPRTPEVVRNTFRIALNACLSRRQRLAEVK